MSNAQKTLVTIATYNEVENLPQLVEAIVEIAPEVDILVVDDNSPDGTGRWCDAQAARDPRFRVIHREGKLGLGTANLASMRYAIEHDYKQMLNMDADFSHDPKYIPELLAAMARKEDDPRQRVDVAIGSRYVLGGAIEGWPIKRHLMSRGVNVASRWLLSLPVKDCSGAFRCYRTDALRRVDFTTILSCGYAFQEEILWRLRQVGARIVESPVVFVNRRRGASKIHAGEAYGALWTLLRLGTRNWLGGRVNRT